MTHASLLETDYGGEGRRLLGIIVGLPGWPGSSRITGKDMAFVRSLQENPDKPISQRMVFWLRDIRDRLLESP